MNYYYCKIIWLLQRRDVNNTSKKNMITLSIIFIMRRTQKKNMQSYYFIVRAIPVLTNMYTTVT